MNYDEQYFKSRSTRLTWLKHPFWRSLIKNKGISILDIGCGEGLFLKWAEKHKYLAGGIDISEEAIRLCGEKGLAVKQASIENIPLLDKSLDIVTCFDILEHLEHLDIALLEVKRVMKDEATLIISVPNTKSIGKQLKNKEWFAFRDKTHVNVYHEEVWRAELARVGFIIKDKFYDALWDPPYVTYIPNLIQKIVCKTYLILFYWTRFPTPRSLGENVYFICKKR